MLFPASRLVNAAFGTSPTTVVFPRGQTTCNTVGQQRLHDSRMPTSLRLSSNKGVIGPRSEQLSVAKGVKIVRQRSGCRPGGLL
jgi:hypothetical protein